VTTLVRPLSFDLSGMGGPAGSLSSRQHSSRGHRGTQAPPPRQAQHVVFKKIFSFLSTLLDFEKSFLDVVLTGPSVLQ